MSDIEQVIAQQMCHRRDTIERACETALQGGEFGVLVCEDYVIGGHPDVPYGQIYHWPGKYEDWDGVRDTSG